MERCNARSMEIYRRLGLHEEIRRHGQHENSSMSVAIVTGLSDPPLAWLDYPTVAAMREKIATTNDGSLPCEPYQVISQYTLEPILRRTVEQCAKVRTFFGFEFERHIQNVPPRTLRRERRYPMRRGTLTDSSSTRLSSRLRGDRFQVPVRRGSGHRR